MLRFAIFPAFFSTNHTALREESDVTACGSAEVVMIKASSYSELPPVSLPRIEILLLFSLAKTVRVNPLITANVMSEG